MEYKVNKIDTDLRIKVNELTKEGKIHTKDTVFINKDQGKKERNNGKKFELKLNSDDERKFTVEAEKAMDIEVQAQKSDVESIPTMGRFIDYRK